jgi:hypothetical protein
LGLVLAGPVVPVGAFSREIAILPTTSSVLATLRIIVPTIVSSVVVSVRVFSPAIIVSFTPFTMPTTARAGIRGTVHVSENLVH